MTARQPWWCDSETTSRRRPIDSVSTDDPAWPIGDDRRLARRAAGQVDRRVHQRRGLQVDAAEVGGGVAALDGVRDTRRARGRGAIGEAPPAPRRVQPPRGTGDAEGFRAVVIETTTRGERDVAAHQPRRPGQPLVQRRDQPPALVPSAARDRSPPQRPADRGSESAPARRPTNPEPPRPRARAGRRDRPRDASQIRTHGEAIQSVDPIIARTPATCSPRNPRGAIRTAIVEPSSGGEAGGDRREQRPDRRSIGSAGEVRERHRRQRRGRQLRDHHEPRRTSKDASDRQPGVEREQRREPPERQHDRDPAQPCGPDRHGPQRAEVTPSRPEIGARRRHDRAEVRRAFMPRPDRRPVGVVPTLPEGERRDDLEQVHRVQRVHPQERRPRASPATRSRARRAAARSGSSPSKAETDGDGERPSPGRVGRPDPLFPRISARAAAPHTTRPRSAHREILGISQQPLRGRQHRQAERGPGARVRDRASSRPPAASRASAPGSGLRSCERIAGA